MKRSGLTLLLAALILPRALGQSGTAPWVENLHLSATGTVAAVNNISRTSHQPTSKDATTFELNLTSTHARQLAPSLLLVATGEAGALLVPDFDRTDHQRLGGRLALQHKFGLGPQAPVLSVNAGATYRMARFDGDKGWTTEAGLELAKRVLPQLRLAASANWLEHAARRATFDLNQHTYAFDARWDIDDRWSLAGSAGRLSGDIVANAAWSIWGTMLAGGFGPVIFDYYTSRPWMVTDLYGPGWVSYNVEADVDLWSVALSYAWSDQTALELRKSAAYVVNRVGVAYPTDSWSLGLTHRF
ncbi:hypothetical protein Verru16b_02095 [Lacunisphaera limnophila]|uniref:Uncharacterized protein n=1 Tax=Lacunisphaera limnophila TaxID=1838286 RepID=A0A1D8AVY3_9BACT|nr:hypothetical protein [Lacunisphaera limnophila]AOS45026.1 hypothetical protein Verru16b_02095 [Lacunisphaera limnophila]